MTVNHTETTNAIEKLRRVLAAREKLLILENKDAGHDVAEALDESTSVIVDALESVLDCLEETEADRREAWSVAAGLALRLRDAEGALRSPSTPDAVAATYAALARYDAGVKP